MKGKSDRLRLAADGHTATDTSLVTMQTIVSNLVSWSAWEAPAGVSVFCSTSLRVFDVLSSYLTEGCSPKQINNNSA